MTLYLVGLGISGYDSIPQGAIRAIKACRTVYLETFTSPVADMSYLEELNPNIVHAKRWMVEDGRHILDSAEGHDTAVVSYGDPLVATTHSDLLVRAASRGIPVCVIHASSAIPSMVGRCGLAPLQNGAHGHHNERHKITYHAILYHIPQLIAGRPHHIAAGV